MGSGRIHDYLQLKRRLFGCRYHIWLEKNYGILETTQILVGVQRPEVVKRRKTESMVGISNSLVTTLGLMAFYCESIGRSRNDRISDVYLKILIEIVKRATEVFQATEHILHGTFTFTIKDGFVDRFAESLVAHFGIRQTYALQTCWISMKQTRLISTAWDLPSLTDVVRFLVFAVQDKKKGHRGTSTRADHSLASNTLAYLMCSCIRCNVANHNIESNQVFSYVKETMAWPSKNV